MGGKGFLLRHIRVEFRHLGFNPGPDLFETLQLFEFLLGVGIAGNQPVGDLQIFPGLGEIALVDRPPAALFGGRGHFDNHRRRGFRVDFPGLKRTFLRRRHVAAGKMLPGLSIICLAAAFFSAGAPLGSPGIGPGRRTDQFDHLHRDFGLAQLVAVPVQGRDPGGDAARLAARHRGALGDVVADRGSRVDLPFPANPIGEGIAHQFRLKGDAFAGGPAAPGNGLQATGLGIPGSGKIGRLHHPGIQAEGNAGITAFHLTDVIAVHRHPGQDLEFDGIGVPAP